MGPVGVALRLWEADDFIQGKETFLEGLKAQGEVVDRLHCGIRRGLRRGRLGGRRRGVGRRIGGIDA